MKRWGTGGKLTLGDAGDGKAFVAVRLSQGKQNINLGPIGHNLLDELDLGAVEFLELAHLALVLQRGQR